MKINISITCRILLLVISSLFGADEEINYVDRYYPYLSQTFGFTDKSSIQLTIKTKQSLAEEEKKKYYFYRKDPEKLKSFISRNWPCECEEFIDEVLYFKTTQKDTNNAIRIIFRGDSTYYVLQNWTDGNPDSLWVTKWVTKDWSETSFTNYKDGVMHGELRTYHPTGEKKCTHHYIKGKMVGKYECYYENGQL